MPLQFITNELDILARRILPQNQHQYLADKNAIGSSLSPLYDRIFVCEKFAHLNILPVKRNIVYSSKFYCGNLKPEHIKRVETLEVFLATGNPAINLDNQAYLPPSTNTYFLGNSKYNVDFSAEFWGVKHFHVSKTRKDDILLFYAVHGNSIYFLSLGSHADLYSKKFIEIVISEFPQLMTPLGFGAMPDMPIGGIPNESTEHIKKQWTKGSNVSFVIDGKFYIAANGQTTARLNSDIIYKASNILYQIDNQMQNFDNFLATKHPNIPFEYKINELESRLLIKAGQLCVSEERTKEQCLLNIKYLDRINEIESIVNIN